MVFAGLIFGGRLFDIHSIGRAVAAFAIFCGLSSAAYLINDVADRGAGLLTSTAALVAAAILCVVSVAGAFAVRAQLGAVGVLYVALLLLYSLALKHAVILDVLTIAAGFVLSAVAGAVALDVPISSWLLVCTTLLALFLALSKRRHELTLLGDQATWHRRILQEYSPYLLDQMISVVTASTLIAYSVYATSADTAARLGTSRLGLTIPFVLYGIFRYLGMSSLRRKTR